MPELPPGVDLESARVLKACIPARVALAELKQAVGSIPNPRILIGTLPLLEAQASSEIENIVTTTDRLFRHQSSISGADPATREALRYRGALVTGADSLTRHPLSTRTAELVATEIRGTLTEVRRVSGTVLRNLVSGEAIYTPPDGEDRLRTLLANWERFLHRDDGLDPLVRMAVSHYQFEAIHPFLDGNGRAGRVLNGLFLVEKGLIADPILYMSRSIINRKQDYYQLLLGVTADGKWEEWVLFMLEVVADAAMWTTQKIVQLRALEAETIERVRGEFPKIYSRELVDVIFTQPYVRIGNVVDAGVVGRQAASRYLKSLASIGVLEERRAGRETLFVHTRLIQLLTG